MVLAAALVVVLAVPAHADGIVICGYDGGPCSGSGNFFANLGYQSVEWRFYDQIAFDNGTGGYLPIGDLHYSFKISGTPVPDFVLDVMDVWTDPSPVTLPDGASVNCVKFETANSPVVVPADSSPQCVLFDVTGDGGVSDWQDGYWVTIRWITPLGDDPFFDRLAILKAELVPGNIPNYDWLNPTILSELRFNPLLTPTDPGIGGKGNGFSEIGVFGGPDLEHVRRVDTKDLDIGPVPEPASMVLVGTGLAGLIARARRRKK